MHVHVYVKLSCVRIQFQYNSVMLCEQYCK